MKPLTLALTMVLAALTFSAASKGRAAEAESCPEAEQPIPRTIEDAVARIVSKLDAKSMEALRSTKRENLALFHGSWGMGIRNSMCLWGDNEQLRRSACGGQLCHPDNASMRIMEAVWDRIHSLEPKAQQSVEPDRCVHRPMTDGIPDGWRTAFRWHGGQCSGMMPDSSG